MQTFYERQPEQILNSGFRLKKIQPFAVGTQIYYTAIVSTGNYEPATFGFLPSAGRMLIEWDSSLAWSEMSLIEIAEQKPEKAQICRVFISPLLNLSGLDKDGLMRIQNKINDPTVYAQVDPASQAGREIEMIFQKNLRKKLPLTVKMNWDPKENIRRVDEVLHLHWLAPFE